jgi:malate synthase
LRSFSKVKKAPRHYPKRRWPGSAPIRSAKPAAATTERGSRTPALCRSLWKSSTASCRSQTKIDKQLPDYKVTAEDLLLVPEGTISEAGVRQNVAVGIGYLEAWVRGIGCVPLFNLMEDAATAEISRAQLWQWVHHAAHLSTGELVTADLCHKMIDEELARAKSAYDSDRYQAYEKAASMMRTLIDSPKFADFLTLGAYANLIATESKG